MTIQIDQYENLEGVSDRHFLSVTGSSVLYHFRDGLDDIITTQIISLNLEYVQWLLKNAYTTYDLYQSGEWFISTKHRDGETKYLKELQAIVKKHTNF